METLQELDIVRAVSTTVRTAPTEGAGMPTMEVRFSQFDEWYEIDSFWEGQFLERTEKGAFAKTIAESRDQIRVLFNHGFDPSIGNKVLGSIAELREDDDSPVGVVPLFDTSYNRDLTPGLEAGVYGSSFRMRVVQEQWNDAPDVSKWNPKGIPERTIKEVRLYEFGPVTFPANPASTAGLRATNVDIQSTTDEYIERLRSLDPHKVEELARARQTCTPLERAAGSTTAPPDGAARTTADEPPDGHSGGLTPAQRRERFRTSLQKG